MAIHIKVHFINTKNMEEDINFTGLFASRFCAKLSNELTIMHSYYFSNGDQYDGEWVRGMKQGHGAMKYSDGTIYDVSGELVFLFGWCSLAQDDFD